MVNSSKKNQVKQKAFILSLKDETRNLNLKNDLENQIAVEICKGFDGNKRPEILQSIDIGVSKKLQNRELNLNEIACAQGHREMLIKASNDGIDVAYFLEDDAVLPDEFNALELSMNLNVAMPVLCLLSYESEKVLSFRLRNGPFDGFAKCISLPTCAQFYAINKRGLDLLAQEWSNRKCSEVADFPTWYWDQVRFFLAPLNKKAIVSRESSTINSSRLKSSRSTLGNRLIRYSCLTWFLYFRKSLSIKAYLAFFHGRLLQSILVRSKRFFQ